MVVRVANPFGGPAQDETLAIASGMLGLLGLGDRRRDHVGDLNLHEQHFPELARAIELILADI